MEESSQLIKRWTAAPVHVLVQPLSWLIGTWKTVEGEGDYPTLKPFNYCDEITFSSYGQPMLNYNAVSWHPVKKTPMHLESGYLRIQPDTKKLTLLSAHNFGLTSLEEGDLIGAKSMKLRSSNISRMHFARDPQVVAIERLFELNNGKLIVTFFMQTGRVEMTQHLKAVYEKIG